MSRVDATKPRTHLRRITRLSSLRSSFPNVSIKRRREGKNQYRNRSAAPARKTSRDSASAKRHQTLSKVSKGSDDETTTKNPNGQALVNENGALSMLQIPCPGKDTEGLGQPSDSIQNPTDERREPAEERLEKMCGAVRTLLECMGEDPHREGLRDTPSRYAKALLFFTKAYRVDIDSIINGAVFCEGHDEMIMVKDIDIHSLCEHHLIPFTGK
ncbi:hypothetical protein LTR48_001335, partial [Friedmanniomyces endolithicus]